LFERKRRFGRLAPVSPGWRGAHVRRSVPNFSLSYSGPREGALPVLIRLVLVGGQVLGGERGRQPSTSQTWTGRPLRRSAFLCSAFSLIVFQLLSQCPMVLVQPGDWDGTIVGEQGPEFPSTSLQICYVLRFVLV
jgi:hypothetical protein